MSSHQSNKAKMKAAVIHGPRDIRVEAVDRPAIQNDEVLVKVKVCGICGTDLHLYKTGTAPNKILGHEWSGEVAEIGSDIKGLNVGDRVAGVGYRLSGGHYNVPGEGLDGAFAEYVAVPKPLVGNTFLKLPDGLSLELAATIEPVSIACFAVEQAQLQPKDSVVIFGAGMIGQCIVQICKALGVSNVIVFEPSAKRRAMASEMGAAAAFNPLETDPVKAVEEATEGRMASVIFECSGVPTSFFKAIQMARFFGRIMQIGFFEQDIQLSAELVNRLTTYRNITWRGCGGQKWDMALDMVNSGKVNTKKLITHEFPLESIQEAFKVQLDAEKAIKVIVKP